MRDGHREVALTFILVGEVALVIVFVTGALLISPTADQGIPEAGERSMETTVVLRGVAYASPSVLTVSVIDANSTIRAIAPTQAGSVVKVIYTRERKDYSR